MKKHLMIAGISRGGKSTICNEILKNQKYHYIQMDRIVRAFQNHFPETGITHQDRIWNVSKNLAPFLNSMLEDDLDNYLLIDTYHVVPEDYVKYINQEICDVCFVGYPDISVEQKFHDIRNFDQREEDRQKSDDELKEKCKRLMEESKFLQAECEKYQLPFLNTSFDRNDVIARYVASLN